MEEAVEAAKRHMAAFNAHDIEAHKANEAADVEWVVPGGITLRGPDQVAQFQSIYWEALPDAKVNGANINYTFPAYSITLLVVDKAH